MSFDRSTPSRRAMLASTSAALVASPALLRHVNAQGLEKIRITLPWLPEGSYAYAFVARAKGFWRERGLDVDIARGTGALAAAQNIAQGQFDLGLSTAGALVLLSDKGVDLKSIALVDYEPTMAVAVLGNSPVKSPKDLEGKKVGQTLASTDAPFFAPFCKINGVDISKVQLLNMDARVRNQALVEGKVDAITGLASSVYGAVGASGTPVRFMLYSDYGLTLYGNVALVATPKVLESRKAMCQAVADGLMEGLRLTLAKPTEAQELFLSAVPELKMTATGPQFTRLGMGVQRFSVLTSPEARTNGLGWHEIAKLEKMTDFVMEYQASPGSKRLDVKGRFTNEFVGKVKMSEAEWAAADKETDWVRKALGRNA